MTALRDAERAVTEAAGSAAAGDERPPPAATIGAAVRAVLADADALAALRAGRLVDVPSAGGFGLAGLGLGGASDADDGEPTATPTTGPPRRAPPCRETRQAQHTGRRVRTAVGVPPPHGRAVVHPPRPPVTAPEGGTQGARAARRAVADAEEAVRIATEAVAEADAEVDTAEDDERAAPGTPPPRPPASPRSPAISALEVAPAATNPRREAAGPHSAQAHPGQGRPQEGHRPPGQARRLLTPAPRPGDVRSRKPSRHTALKAAS